MTYSVWDFSATAASNNQATPQGWPEGQSPSTVNDCARQLIAMIYEGLAVSTVAGGTADALTVTYTNIPTAPSTLIDGMAIKVRAVNANATTTPTLAINGGTARTITKFGGTALIAGDIPGNLAELDLRYNLANTRWELLNPAGGDVDTTTWTPTDASGASLSLTVTDAFYTKKGKQVTISFNITYPTTADTTTAKIGGLPFKPKAMTGLNEIFPISLANDGRWVARLDNTGSAATMTFASQSTTATTIRNVDLTGNVISGTFTYICV